MSQMNSYKIANFTLIDKDAILEKFKIIESQNIVLTAEPFGFITSICRVNHEENLLVFAASPDETLNQKFINSGACTLIGRVDGVFAVFLVKNVVEATFLGKKVYMAPIPASLFWHQRREFYRVPIDFDHAFLCSLPLISGERIDFPVIDITLSGLAIFDQTKLLGYEYKRGHVFNPCTFKSAGLDGKSFELELRNKPGKELRAGRRIGLSFLNSDETLIAHLSEIIDKFGRTEDDSPIG